VPQKLEIYIADDCPTCLETKILVDIISGCYAAGVKIDLINLSNPDTISPEKVFAVPAFIHYDKILFLGNPSLQELDNYFLAVCEP